MSAYIYPSVLFQGITFTAKQWGKFPTISFTAGAMAGFEVVTVTSGFSDINVQVATGVSTTAQVIAAIRATSPSVDNNSAGDLVSMVETTPGVATAPATSSAMSGAIAPNTLGFFQNQSVPLTSSFVYSPFAARFNNIIINNDDTSGGNQVVFSWDGINNHGILNPGESVNFSNANRNAIFLKYGTGAPAYRVLAGGSF